MKKCFVCLLILILLSGCAFQGASLQPLNALKTQSQNAVDTIIYHQAENAVNQLQKSPYSIKVEQTSGPVLTLIVSESQDIHQLIVHEEGYTQWIEVFDDRILCLTGDDGHVDARLLNDLNAYGDMKTIIQCAVDPVSLIQGRHLQRTSGQEKGSVQIATENIDFWMKVNEHQNLSQVNLYFSDLPMMTLYYSLEIPLFPSIQKTDYPMFSDLMNINHENLIEHGFEYHENEYARQTDKVQELLKFDEVRLDYTASDDKRSIQLVYDGLVLKGMHTYPDGAYCEVNLMQDFSEDSELGCTSDEVKEMTKIFEALKKEFK